MKRGFACIALVALLIIPVVLADEAEYTIENEYLRAHFRPDVEAATAAWLIAGIGAVLILLSAVRRWSHLPKKKHTFGFWATTAVKIAIVLIVTYFIWSTYSYMFSGVAKTGIETCDASGCTLSVHWHAKLDHMSVCGKTVERPWETGDLAGPHTHKDNRIHVHALLQLDPKTHIIMNRAPLTLGGFFDSIGWKFNETCFNDRCDTCDGKSATTKVLKNGELLASPFANVAVVNGSTIIVPGTLRDYAWGDGDIIRVEFG